MELAAVPSVLTRLNESIGKVLYGAEAQTQLALVAVMVRGHALLEGVPGTGKTLFCRLLAKSLGVQLRRIQCTPDLMPGDVIGANIFDFRTQSFSLTKGPIFTEFLLVDEINRMPPKSQSALLEAMQERSVTIDGKSYPLSPRFTVIATQNPVEQEGTYPLPEAQLDRFLFKLDATYPPEHEELRAVMTHGASAAMPDVDSIGDPVVTPEELTALTELPATVYVDPRVAQYAVTLVRASRTHQALAVGVSPRAATVLMASSRAFAACQGRNFVLPDDIKAMWVPLARHRVALSSSAEIQGLKPDDVLAEILAGLPVPK